MLPRKGQYIAERKRLGGEDVLGGRVEDDETALR
jgi:hypothetical protein